MDYLALLKSPVFNGLTAADLRDVLDETPHRIQCYDKDETIFLQMDNRRAYRNCSGRTGTRAENLSERKYGECFDPNTR